MAKGWSVEELVTIVRFGGGIDTSARRLTADEAVQIAKFAFTGGSSIIFRDTDHWTAEEAVKIAKFGGGKVVFAD